MQLYQVVFSTLPRVEFGKTETAQVHVNAAILGCASHSLWE